RARRINSTYVHEGVTPQNRFKQLDLLAAMDPAVAMAQSLSNQTSAPAAADPIDADKKAAI
ncbi:hypothetical protein AAHH80_39765, partial [Burkholderia pseudomallei]